MAKLFSNLGGIPLQIHSPDQTSGLAWNFFYSSCWEGFGSWTLLMQDHKVWGAWGSEDNCKQERTLERYCQTDLGCYKTSHKNWTKIIHRLFGWIPLCCLSQCEDTRHSFPSPAVLQTSSSMARGKLTLQELLPLLYSVYLACSKRRFQDTAAKEIKGKATASNFTLAMKSWWLSRWMSFSQTMSQERLWIWELVLQDSFGMLKINAQFVDLLVQVPQCRIYVTARRSSLNDWQRPIGGSRSQLSLCLHTAFLSQAKFL